MERVTWEKAITMTIEELEDEYNFNKWAYHIYNVAYAKERVAIKNEIKRLEKYAGGREEGNRSNFEKYVAGQILPHEYKQSQRPDAKKATNHRRRMKYAESNRLIAIENGITVNKALDYRRSMVAANTGYDPRKRVRKTRKPFWMNEVMDYEESNGNPGNEEERF